MRPVGQIRVAGVRRGTVLHQVAGEKYPLLWQPYHGVALGVPTAELHDLDLELAEPQRQVFFEHQRRPCQAGNRLDCTKKPRKPLDLAFHVGLAALDDQVIGIAAGDDVFGLVPGCAENPHRVVVREHDVFDRLARHLADAPNDVLGHDRCGLGIDHHHRVIADDDAGVRVAFRGEGIGVIGQLVEADRFFLEIGLRSELLVAHR